LVPPDRAVSPFDAGDRPPVPHAAAAAARQRVMGARRSSPLACRPDRKINGQAARLRAAGRRRRNGFLIPIVTNPRTRGPPGPDYSFKVTLAVGRAARVNLEERARVTVPPALPGECTWTRFFDNSSQHASL